MKPRDKIPSWEDLPDGHEFTPGETIRWRGRLVRLATRPHCDSETPVFIDIETGETWCVVHGEVDITASGV